MPRTFLLVALLCASGAVGIEPQGVSEPELVVVCADPQLADRCRREVDAARLLVVAWFAEQGHPIAGEDLVSRVEVFTARAAAQGRLAEAFGVSDDDIPDSFAGTVDASTLYLVSPDLYRESFVTLYGEALWGDDEYRKLVVHELVHKGHATVATRLFGNEDGMGPQWLFEGLAITVSGQFPVTREVGAVDWPDFVDFVEQAARGAVEAPVYPKYSRYFAYALQAAGYPWLLANAGRPDLMERLEPLAKAASSSAAP